MPKRRLGQLEQQLLAYAQLRKLTTLKTGDLLEPLDINSKQERELFSRLHRSGMIAQVRRGLYLVPPRLPLGAQWNPGEIASLNAVMKDQEGIYQICGPNTFNRYGFDEQIPTRLYVYNNRLSEERKIGSLTFMLIKVADKRLGETEKVETSEGITAIYSSRTRTLVDAVYDWSRFNSLPRAYEWIKRELAADRISAENLARITLRYSNQGTIRRIGALLEREGVSETILERLEKKTTPTSSLIPWIPNYPKRGTTNQRWKVVYNEKT